MTSANDACNKSLCTQVSHVIEISILVTRFIWKPVFFGNRFFGKPLFRKGEFFGVKKTVSKKTVSK